MSEQITEEIKARIFKLITIPGMELQDIAEKVNLDYDIVMNILSEEYLRNDLDHGRRLCCRY